MKALQAELARLHKGLFYRADTAGAGQGRGRTRPERTRRPSPRSTYDDVWATRAVKTVTTMDFCPRRDEKCYCGQRSATHLPDKSNSLEMREITTSLRGSMERAEARSRRPVPIES